MMASNYPEDPRPPRPLRTAVIIAVTAFVIGLALMAWALTRWEPLKQFVRGNDTVAVVQPNAARTIVAPPPSGVMATEMATETMPVPATSGQAIAIDTRIADLEGRMARIDLRAAAAAGNAARAEGLLIAFAARRALDRGVALGYIEGELRDRFGPTQPRAVAAIIAGAQAPVTLEGLQRGLIALRPDLVGGGTGESWWEATRRTLGSLIVVRKQGSDSPVADDRVERAILRIEGGQVEGALAEIARIPAHAKADDWMTHARHYVEAHQALDIIEAAALTDQPAAQPAL